MQSTRSLRSLRKARGWSQEHLAQVSKVGRATIQRIERGHVVPSPETTMALAAALDTEAIGIRSHSGLSAAVTRLMASTVTRDPTVAELSTLPARERDLFAAYFRARHEMAAASQGFADACAAVPSAFEEVLRAEIAIHVAMCRALVESNERSRQELELRKLESTAVQVRISEAEEALRQACGRVSASSEVFCREWTRLIELCVKLL